MHEVDAVPEATHHGGQVVLCTHAKRTRAEAEAVSRAWNGVDECLEVLGCAEDAGQSKYRHRWVVGMNDESYAGLLGSGTHLL